MSRGPSGRLIGKPSAPIPGAVPSQPSPLPSDQPPAELTRDYFPSGQTRAPQIRAATREPAQALPTRLGAYAVEGEVARGGMGVVLRARHTELRRAVAIKLLRPEMAEDEGSVERFLREARATACLKHPGIVAIHDVARDDEGNPYLVMDFVEGESLRARLEREGPLAPRAAAELLEAVAEAVGHAHAQGILHRDLKPDNVLLERSSGAPLLTDFGLAKVVHSDEGETTRRRRGGGAQSADLTQVGEIIGTPRYMAPEQVDPSRAAPGPGIDVWALGVILYQCLTGRLPFPGPSVMQTFEQVLYDDPPPPSRHNPLLPAAFEAVCMRCLARDPAARYASAGEVAQALARARRELARPVVRRGAPQGPAPATPWGPLLRLAGGLAVCGAAAVALWGALPGVRGRAQAAGDGSPSPVAVRLEGLLASPGAPSPGVPSPGATSPGATSPGAPSPGAPSPGAPSPGASPGASSPGVTPGPSSSASPAGASPGELALAAERALGRPGGGPEGRRLLEQAAVGGCLPAYVRLGVLLRDGRADLPPDAAAALRWLREGAELHAAGCDLQAGAMLIQRADPLEQREGRERLQRTLEGGELRQHPQVAQLLTLLGDAWCRLEPRDEARGRALLEEAAGKDDAAAMVQLAELLGRGGAAAQVRARAYLERAAASGDRNGCYLLGDCLSRGRMGYARDRGRARAMFAAAAAAGHAGALARARALGLSD